MDIPLKILNEIVDYSNFHAPEETCGAIAGSPVHPALDVVPMDNDHENPESYYRFDPYAWVIVCHALEEQGKRPLVIYHSHPRGDSYPSASDIAASIEGMLYLIYSPQGFSLWEIRDKQYVIEEPLVVT